jgi:hypothetical protein
MVLGAIVLTLSADPAFGQQRGTIAGRVVDASGLGMPGATVTVTEQNTGFTRTVVSAETGGYNVPSLDPGIYTIVVEMSGFATAKQTDLQLTAGQNVASRSRCSWPDSRSNWW